MQPSQNNPNGILEASLTGLNPPQMHAVKCTFGPLLVLAGAGTGKTKVITTRIAHMIQSGIPANQIVAVSFTNKAATEMKQRLAQIVGKQTADKCFLSTFHSFALSILYTNFHKLGFKQKPTIVDELESEQLIKESLKENKLTDIMTVQSAKSRISDYKDKLFTSESFQTATNIFDRSIMKTLFVSYNRGLRLRGYIDFDDIVYLTVLLLKQDANTLKNIQTKYNYLLVDEFQDTSRSQLELVKILSSATRNICVVGDDDQSIYGWRGAYTGVIQDFLNEFPETVHITLEQNYRCSPNILSAANAVISFNTDRMIKTLWSDNTNQTPVSVYAADTPKDEAQFVCDKLAELKKNNPSLQWHENAILFRSRKLMLTLEQTLTASGIAIDNKKSKEIFNRKEVQDLLSYVRFAANSRDLNSFLRIANLSSAGLSLDDAERLKDNFEAHDTKSIPEIIVMGVEGQDKLHKYLPFWHETTRKLQSAQDNTELASILSAITETNGLKSEILRTSKDMRTATDRLKSLDRLIGWIATAQEQGLDNVASKYQLEQFSPSIHKKDLNGVQFLTIHSSKGLEFENVFVIGVEDDIIPHKRNHESGIEEERRLFYVAMTRAKRNLFISHCSSRGGTGYEPKPSRFLADIPNDIVSKSEDYQVGKEQKRLESATKLFDLFR